MDIVQAVSGYITKMVSAGDSAATGTAAAKMKILLLDSETVGLSSLSKCDRQMLTGPDCHCDGRDDAVRPAQS
jgi:vacuolar protein sorting-associated protein 45